MADQLTQAERAVAEEMQRIARRAESEGVRLTSYAQAHGVAIRQQERIQIAEEALHRLRTWADRRRAENGKRADRAEVESKDFTRHTAKAESYLTMLAHIDEALERMAEEGR